MYQPKAHTKTTQDMYDIWLRGSWHEIQQGIDIIEICVKLAVKDFRINGITA